jgi:hypothetical protein
LDPAGVAAGFAVVTLSVGLICGGSWALFEVSSDAFEADADGRRGEWRMPRFLRLALMPLFLAKTVVAGAAIYVALAVLALPLLAFGAGMAVGLVAFSAAVVAVRGRFFLLPNA